MRGQIRRVKKKAIKKLGGGPKGRVSTVRSADRSDSE